jgi:anti-anti-sigma factor
MGTVRISAQGSEVTASFDGELDIYSVAALQQSLWGAIDKATSLRLELQEVEEIDLAGVQLLAWVRAVSQARAIAFGVATTSPAVIAAASALNLSSWLVGSTS